MRSYPWLTADGEGYEADMEGCTPAEMDRRMVIMQELRAGRLVSASFTDGDVERVAEAWMRALYGAEAFEDIGVEDNDRQVARAALTAYLEDKA